MTTVCLHAHAKLNLTLDVLFRRRDGYHAIRSVMQSIQLYDRLVLSRQAASRGLSLSVSAGGCASGQPTRNEVPTDASNLAWRAADLFFDYTGIRAGLTIDLQKNIPSGAGLGGGSADAAAVLKGLDKLFAAGLSSAELELLGLRLGADVPFCIAGGTQLAEGIGEQLSPLLPLPRCWMVLVFLPPIATGEVFSGLDQQAMGDVWTSQFLAAWTNDQADSRTTGPSLQTRTMFAYLGNALESVTGMRMPSICQWKQRMITAGALCALMSGSGSTVYGVFRTKTQAERFVEHWRESGCCLVTKPTDRGIRFVDIEGVRDED